MSTARLSIIPGWVVADRRLKGRDLQVLCVLGQHTNRKHGWCRRSQVKMAEEMGCARSTVQASIDRLVSIGAVERREVISDSGRDSAHWYRVIYDVVTPEAAFREWGGDADLSDEEFGPISDDFDAAPPADRSAPPAGISAPPAAPESAPPAGPGSAPINVSTLTPPAEPSERERGGARSVERDFRRWYPTWPTYDVDSETEARKAWFALSDDEREAAAKFTAAYVEAVKRSGRQRICAPAVYLKERRWARLAAKAEVQTQPATIHKPFSKAWQGLALSHFLGPEAPLPQMSAFMQGVVAGGGARADAMRRDHRQRWAWPKATEMYQAADEYRGQLVPTDLVEASEGFRSYHKDSPEVAAWRRYYEAMGWLFPRLGNAQWICFPEIADASEGSVVAAIESFKALISEGQDDHDAA